MAGYAARCTARSKAARSLEADSGRRSLGCSRDAVLDAFLDTVSDDIVSSLRLQRFSLG